MRIHVLSAVALLLVPLAQGQTALESKAIARAKRLPVSRLDSRLPKVSLEKFLQAQAGAGAEMRWESNDCGEQTGDPKLNHARDLPVCTQANVLLKDGRKVTVMVAVGTLKKGIAGTPGLWWLEVIQPDGSSESLERLGDLPPRLLGPGQRSESEAK